MFFYYHQKFKFYVLVNNLLNFCYRNFLLTLKQFVML